MPDSSIRHAVILAAGKGTRMGSMTQDTPKPMLRVHGKPILEHILEGLASTGVEKFLIVVGYHGDMIRDYFANWHLPIEFRVQEVVNGTATALLLAGDWVGNDPFLLTFGDILVAPSAYTNCAAELTEEVSAVLGVREEDDPWRGAAVYVENGRITRVIEKPPQGTSTTHWNSAGLYAMRPVVFGYLEKVQPSARNEYEATSIFDAMVQDGLELRISPITDQWRDVGDPEELNAANAG